MADSVHIVNVSMESSLEVDKLLRAAHHRKVQEHIPLLAFLSAMAIVGIIGNILTIIFYGFKLKMKKTSTIVLIILLACIDLIVCFLLFTTIADLCVNILFTNAILCKAMYFFDHWIVVSSVLTLWIIAIDRHRKICKPLGKQLTVKYAKIAVLVMSVLSMLFSTHDFITYNPVQVNISTSDNRIPFVTGHYCTNTDDEELETVVIVFHILDALIIFACLLTFVYTYGNIWRALRQHNKKSNLLQVNTSSTSLRQSYSELNGQINQSDDENIEEPIQFNVLTRNHKVHFSLDSNIDSENVNLSSSAIASIDPEPKRFSTTYVAQAMSPRPPKTSRSERNVTIMMFAVTVGFAICFTPYFIVSVGIRVTSATTESELHTGIEFALRSPFWNSVINPIIFCVFNPQYRRYVKYVFTKCSVNEAMVNSTTG